MNAWAESAVLLAAMAAGGGIAAVVALVWSKIRGRK